MRRFSVLMFIVLTITAAGRAETISAISWNVESGGADPVEIAKRVRRLQTAHKPDVWGFSEVQNDTWAEKFEQAAAQASGSSFKRIVGTTGRSDLLAIVYNTDRLEYLGHQELHRVNLGGHVRAPLVAAFKTKKTGRRFLFMVNHLYRSKADARHDQATLLNRWATQQKLPIIAVGDYNFDWKWDYKDRGLDNMTAGGVFTWIRPTRIASTQDSALGAILDFVFISGRDTWTWKTTSTIIVEKGDFPDTDETPDHRPLTATIEIPEGVGP
jgi:endonuclease/exonuclease/phosphatase family metal-dependent hydrolase